jgi:putative DNA primase/helicase
VAGRVLLLVAAGVKRVVLIPDNDQPGRDHVDQVARMCIKAGLKVKVAVLPGVPDKGDVSDYLATHSKADLIALLRAAVEYDVLMFAGQNVPSNASTTSPPAAPLGPVIVCGADVRSERPEWLWRRRLARGKLTLLMGDPGVGKSFITVDATARITRGQSWPDGDGMSEPGNVLFLAVEDGIADTIKPRLERAGADHARWFVFQTIRDEQGERMPNFERDILALEQVIVEYRPVLVVVDPISSYLGKTDSYKDADVRRVLAPLALLAEKHKVAVLALVHMTKGSKEGKALYRAMASIAFSAIARIHLAAGSDPEQPERCYLMPVKQNICPASAALAYRLVPDHDDEDGPARLEWEGAPVEGVHADAILGTGLSASEREQQKDAAEFLAQLLADGRMRSEEVFKVGKANGYSDSTLNRAKRRAKVRAVKEGFRSGWCWELDPNIAPKVTMHRDLTTFGENSAASPSESTPSSKIVTKPDLTTFVAEDDDPEAGLV